MCKSRLDIRWLAVAIFWTAATLILTHLPQETIPPVLRQSGLDKLEHVVAYGVIMSLFLIALRIRPAALSVLRLFLVFAVIAALDELTQGLVNRTPSIADFAANILGMLLALCFCTLWRCPLRRLSP